MKQSFLVLATFFSLHSIAQNGVISGKVSDGENHSFLPGATIRIEDSNRYTISENDGSYEFLSVPEGTYSLYVEYIGYYSEYMEVVVTSNESTVVNFELFPGSQELKELVIVGNSLKGQAKALNKQKSNENVSNIISADQVGRFPDANIGDALKRVSGVTMQNDQGEARDIIIRGLSPDLNSVTLNGERIPSAEGDNRNVQMDLIPSDMISTIEVNKTLTPDMDGDAIGGSVNLVTKASPNRERISATLAGGYAPVRQQPLYNTAFVYGNRFLDNRLGIIASGSFHVQNFGSDNIEAEWKKKSDESAYVSQKDIRTYDVQRIRRSVSFSTDYSFNDDNQIELSAIYNWRDDRENRYRIRYRKIKPLSDGTYESEIRRETKGGLNDGRNKNTRLEDQRVYNISLKGKHLLSSKLDMKWAFNYSKASEDRPNERYIDFNQKKVNVTEDLSDTNFPLVKSVEEQKPENFKLRKLTENHNYTEEDKMSFKVDFRTPFSIIENEKGRLRFGGKVNWNGKKRDNIFYEYEPLYNLGTLADVKNQFLHNEHFMAGSQYIPGYFATNDFLGNLDLNNASKFTKTPNPSEYLAKNYQAKERVLAAYLRWDQDFSEQTKLITGLRLEQTLIDYRGNYVIDESDLKEEIKSQNRYLNLLPSITLKHQFTEDFVLRTALTTGIARPKYYQLAPYINAVADESELSTGNPDLKATYSMNVDVMAENYFDNIGIISGGVFYKNLKDFVYTYREKSYTSANFDKQFPNLPNPIPAGDEWEYKTAKNGDAVSVYGFEVAVQRQLDFLGGNFFKNMNVYANYTYTKSIAKGITNEDGEQREGLGLPKTAPHMLNGSLSWENKKLLIRLSANYTAAYLDEVGAEAFEDTYYDQQFFLDANFSYKIKKQWTIFAEATNLTNQPLRYYQGEENYLKQLEFYGPRFNLGVKFDL